jgi:transcriptional regulator with XRE-family HTH domain
MNDLYDDASLGEAVGVGRGAVAGWWHGAKPSGVTIYRLADVTGLSPDELTRFVYSDGPPPALPLSPSEADEARRRADRAEQELRGSSGSAEQPGQPAHRETAG